MLEQEQLTAKHTINEDETKLFQNKSLKKSHLKKTPKPKEASSGKYLFDSQTCQHQEMFHVFIVAVRLIS